MPLNNLFEAGVSLGIEGAPGDGEEIKVRMVRNLKGQMIMRRFIGQGLLRFRRKQEMKRTETRQSDRSE